MATDIDPGQAEHGLISTSLEVEQLDTNLFRSKRLYIPTRARGVFGGQVISQALVSATNCVDPQFALHSLHCYFVLSAAASVPILYYVERIREGRTYTTRSVKAVQNGRVVFIMMCSFQRPEPDQPSHQWQLPPGVPSPNQCEYEEDVLKRTYEEPGVSERSKEALLQVIADRKQSPIAIKLAKDVTSPDGVQTLMWWMKARGPAKYDAPFQKCILAYLSDLHFIGTANRALGLHRTAKNRKGRPAMNSSLDHTIWFYNSNFDCSEWILYVMECPRANNGRGVVHGRIYTEAGDLIAVTSQEGVVRAIMDKVGDDAETKAKL